MREYSERQPILVDKHKVLQILVNLIRNAMQAFDDSLGKDKQITLRITDENNRMKIAVIDNGIGIPKENMDRIFGHGFTTRKVRPWFWDFIAVHLTPKSSVELLPSSARDRTRIHLHARIADRRKADPLGLSTAVNATHEPGAGKGEKLLQARLLARTWGLSLASPNVVLPETHPS